MLAEAAAAGESPCRTGRAGAVRFAYSARMKAKVLLKFLHSISGALFGGGVAALLVMAALVPEPSAGAAFAAYREIMHFTARYVLLPGMVLVVVSGLLAIAVHRPFQGARWVWAKAFMAIWIFEGTLGGILAPAERAFKASQQLVYGEKELAIFAEAARHEWGVLWLMAGIAIVNVALAIWRPRLAFGRARKRAAEADSA